MNHNDNFQQNVEQANQIHAEKLIEYGEQFLTKSIETMLVNPDFFVQVKSYFKIDYFDTAIAHKRLLEIIYFHYDRYNTIPTVDILESMNNLNPNEVIKKNIKLILEQIRTNISAKFPREHYDFYIQELKTYRKRQIIKDTIKQSIYLLQSSNDFKKVEALLHRSVGDIDLDFSTYDYVSEFENRIKTSSRKAVPTLWPEVDRILEETGPAPGELYIIQGDMGIGKSFMLCQLGINALKQNKNVLYITLETRKRQLALRFDSLISGIPLNDIRDNSELVKESLKKFFSDGQQLLIEEYPNGGITIPELYTKIKQLKNRISNIDLILIDYLDILDLSVYDGQEWQKLKSVYEAARKLAGDFEVPVWSVTHPNTEGIKADVATYEKTYGGPNKFKNVDFIMTLKKLDGKITSYIAKNRIGPGFIFLETELDTYKPFIYVGNKCDVKEEDTDKQSIQKLLKELNILK